MKTRTKIFTAILILLLPASIVGIWYFQSHPQALDFVTSKLGITRLEREEPVEVPPEAAVTVDYVFPFENYEEGFGIYGGDQLDTIRPFTYFKSAGGALWLPWENAEGSAGGFICNENGIVKEILAEELTVLPETREAGLAESVFSDLAEGSYYICLEQNDEFPYMAYYVEAYENADFTPDMVGLATRDRITEDLGYAPYVMFYADDPQDITLHFNNLGENTFNQVFSKAEDKQGENALTKNMPDGSYEISDNGSTVTLKAEYLSTLSKNQAYLFILGRKDGSEFILDGSLEDAPQVIVMSSRDLDMPYVDGPESYSLSSGKDLVLTFHKGASQYVENAEYWEAEVGVLPIPSSEEIETGQFIIPREAIEYFKENSEYSNMGISVIVRLNEAMFLCSGTQVRLED